jgi:hypothetical protein
LLWFDLFFVLVKISKFINIVLFIFCLVQKDFERK